MGYVGIFYLSSSERILITGHDLASHSINLMANLFNTVYLQNAAIWPTLQTQFSAMHSWRPCCCAELM